MNNYAKGKLLLGGGRVIDPANGLDGRYDVLVQDGRIADVIAGGVESAPEGAEVIDCAGKIVSPGFVDIHVHFREPGQEYKEDIETGSRAAAAGGFTTVCCMANTQPTNDNAQVTRYILDRAKEAGLINVLPIAAVTKGLKGEELAEMGDMVATGAVAVSDDGHPIPDASTMRRALEYAKGLGVVLIEHAEDCHLSAGGMMNEGLVSTRLGLRGNPGSSERIAVARDIALAEECGAYLHVAHLSTKAALDEIRRARERGVKVTAEVTPHHLVLTEDDVENYQTNAKMAPPLRTAADRDAMRQGLADGTIDCIATDHAPHSADEKNREFDLAPFGVIGLESALPVSMMLVKEGILTLPQLVEKLTHGAARCLGLGCGTLSRGADADITIFDPDAAVRIDVDTFRSKSRNCPFDGWELSGKIEAVFCGGRRVWG